MNGSDDESPGHATDLRRRLHDASGQLSNAVLALAVMLEDPALEPSRRREVETALAACRAAAEQLREIWPLVPGR